MDKNEKKLIRLKSLKISVDYNLALYYDSQALFDHSHFLYKKIIGENPYFIEAYIKLSELYRMRGNKIKAESYIKSAIEKHYKVIQEERKAQNENVKPEEKEKEKEKDKQVINNNISNNKKEDNKIEKNIQNKDEQKKPEQKTVIKKTHRLISVMNKPVNPMIIQAYYFYENGKEHEAIAILNKILMEYYPHDPYTLTFLANIYYSMSVDIRSKNIDKDKLKKAIELYFRALEYDKYNALAAVGLSNCLCEFNYVDKAIDIYRSVMEKFPNEYNALINSSLIYMDEQKYEKASILLHKVLVNIFHGNNSKIENLLAKCCIEMKEFKSANQYLKNLIMKYPDNSIYQYNYAFLLFSQFEDIINKSTRKYSDTEKAIKLISRALKIFEELNKSKKDEKYDKIIQKSEFFYKCSEMVSICGVNITKANEILKKDLENEEILKKKNEENINEYRKLKEEQKEKEELEEKKKLKEANEQDEEIRKENEELMDLIDKKNQELLIKAKNKEKKSKKKGKKKGKKEEEQEEESEKNLAIDEEGEEKEYEDKGENSEEEKEINSDYIDEEEENRKRKRREEKGKKKLLLKKRRASDDEFDNESKKSNKSENENNEEEKNKKINNEDDNNDNDENGENSNIHDNNEENDAKMEEENHKKENKNVIDDD